jgi:hypothetical protein
MKDEAFLRGAVDRLSCWLSDRSVVLPAQAYFTLALSFNESGPRGADIEQECH